MRRRIPMTLPESRKTKPVKQMGKPASKKTKLLKQMGKPASKKTKPLKQMGKEVNRTATESIELPLPMTKRTKR